MGERGVVGIAHGGTVTGVSDPSGPAPPSVGQGCLVPSEGRSVSVRAPKVVQ
jgi:hypothetical protein